MPLGPRPHGARLPQSFEQQGHCKTFSLGPSPHGGSIFPNGRWHFRGYSASNQNSPTAKICLTCLAHNLKTPWEKKKRNQQNQHAWFSVISKIKQVVMINYDIKGRKSGGGPSSGCDTVTDTGPPPCPLDPPPLNKQKGTWEQRLRSADV